MKNKVIFIVCIALLTALCCASASSAAGAKGAARAQRQAARQARKANKAQRGHYAFGKITAISGSTVTIKPETPQFVAQRAAAAGRVPKPLPASISFSVNSETAYQRQGQSAKLGDYKQGDEIAAVLTGKVRSGQGVALRLMDVQSVSQTYGKGGRFGLPPVYGTVLAVSGTSIKIKPEVPDFVQARREQRRAAKAAAAGLPAPTPKAHKTPKLASEVSATLTGLTVYWQNSAQTSNDPFKVGDKVAVYPAKVTDGSGLTAASVRDYATVQSGAARKHAGRKAGGGRKAGTRAPRTGRKAGAGRARKAAAAAPVS